MPNDIESVLKRFNALLEALSPAKQKALLKEIGLKLSQSQRKRITAQKEPDGSSFAPRKKPKKKSGRIKQEKLFKKLKTAKHLKRKIQTDSVAVGFYGRAGWIAKRHHYGMKETQGKVQIQNTPRKLLGASDEDMAMMEEVILKHLTL